MAKDIILGLLAVVFTGAIFYSMFAGYPLVIIFFGLLLWEVVVELVG